MSEFLTLAEAVRGLKGKSSVSHVGSPKPGSPAAEAPAPAAQESVDRRDYWTPRPDNSLVEVSTSHLRAL